MKYWLSVLLSCVFLQGFSQDYFDIANFTYTNTPPNDFEISNAQTTVEELAFEFNFPILINDKTVLLTGMFTNKTRLRVASTIPKLNLNVFGLNLGINKTFNDKWSGTFLVFPKLASEKITFTNDNFQIALLSLFTNKKRNDLKYKYGLYANTERFGLIIVPIVGLYYLSPNKKFEANLNLPINADLNYELNNKLWLGMKFDGLGTTYNLNKQNYSSSVGSYVSKTSNETLGYLRIKLNKSLYINAEFGYAISRNYRVYRSDDKIDLALISFYLGDDREQLNERFQDGVIFKVELLYRLHFD